MHAQVLLSVNLHEKFKVPSFTNSKDMIMDQNLTYRSRDPDHAH